jgi:hypothetical protein
MFSATIFGPIMANGGSSGGYQVTKEYLDLEQEIKNTCMALYDKTAHSAG